jgi:putative transport protein
MDSIVALLSSSPLLLLFAVIGFGFLLGSIRIAGFSLGPAAVLFVGIFFGSLDSRLRIPELIYVVGLVLFVYTIGLQSGPSFFSSFGRRSLRANILAVAMVTVAAVMTAASHAIFDLPGDALAGVFCGALTNTPALAASIDALHRVSGAYGFSTNAPVIGYSVCYPFGVIGVLIGFYIVSKGPKAGSDSNQRTASGATQERVEVRTFVVTNPHATELPVGPLLSLEQNRGFVLSRMRRGDDTSLVYDDIRLQKGDLVVAVGTPESLARAEELLGERSLRELHRENEEFDFRRIEVSDHHVVGKAVGELHLQEMMDATVTRIRRGDVDFVPTADTVLERGDWVRVLTWAGNIQRLSKFFGDSVKHASETDFLSVSIGLVAGVLLGMLPIPLPGGSHFTLGFAGGPLIAGLVLGRMRRLGSVIWGMPYGVNLTLRQLGLVLFLAGIGTKAGDGITQTLSHGGWTLMLVGAVITLSVTLTVMLVGTRVLGLSYAGAMGLMSGVQTQPACLAYANEHTSSNEPNVWYASVYPATMISKIIVAQLLVGWFVH